MASVPPANTQLPLLFSDLTPFVFGRARKLEGLGERCAPRFLRGSMPSR
ncbi:MAG: hypothetical protein IPF48_15010 [Sphingomonadales bacterium]|nr:hypothetical protein [Sphingomonadales bacterium]